MSMENVGVGYTGMPLFPHNYILLLMEPWKTQSSLFMAMQSEQNTNMITKVSYLPMLRPIVVKFLQNFGET